MSRWSTRGVRLWSAAVLAVGLGSCGGGGGGGPTAALSVVPSGFSAEQSQVVTLTPAAANVSSPKYTYSLALPTALQTLTAAQAAAQIGVVDGTAGTFTAASAATIGAAAAVKVVETTHNLSVEVPLVIVPFVNSVSISPTNPNTVAGQTVSFTVTALDINGDLIGAIQPDFRVTGGIGTIDNTGLFTATTAGSGTVTAAVGGAEAAVAQVTVVGSTAGLSIQPLGNPVQIEAGTTRQFEAVRTDNAGNSAQVTATWSADAAIGTITTAGVLTAATTVGNTGNITATVGSTTATVPVKIVPLMTPPSEPSNVSGTVSSGGSPATASGSTTAAGSYVTASDGTYALFLPAGTYTLSAVSGSASASATVTLASQDVHQTVNLTLSGGSSRTRAAAAGRRRPAGS